MRKNKRADQRSSRPPRTPRRQESRTRLALKESTSIDAAEYDWGRKILRVQFKAGRAAHRGGTYDYFDVSAAVVREFISAPSLGQFVNWTIKPHYRYERVG
jgi:hypothetical protein